MNKDEALTLGAMALFGEKYGDVVRVVIIDPNYSDRTLWRYTCKQYRRTWLLKIKHETAVAAGVRRIEALSGKAAEEFINEQLHQLHAVKTIFNNPKEILKVIENTIAENKELKKQVESLTAKQLAVVKQSLLSNIITINHQKFIGAVIDANNADSVKKLALDLKDNTDIAVIAANIDGKASVAIMLSDNFINVTKLEAPKIIKEHIAPIIKGGGGGQKTLATAGGQDANNLQKVIEVVKGLL
jgi:alanyl-tRNA synthetase